MNVSSAPVTFFSNPATNISTGLDYRYNSTGLDTINSTGLDYRYNSTGLDYGDGSTGLDGRFNITIRRSVDNAQTWSSSLLLDAGQVGLSYSIF
jgi:hypothetical protein